MFNNTYYKNESKVVAITKEIEKTISPDKVTEMYDAVREEVENNIIRSIVVSDNSLHGSVVEINNRYDIGSRVVVLRFTLNGKEHLGKETFPREVELNEARLYELLREFYIKEVTNEVMRHTVDVIPKTVFPKGLIQHS